jgi:hypothetical protein
LNGRAVASAFTGTTCSSSIPITSTIAVFLGIAPKVLPCTPQNRTPLQAKTASPVRHRDRRRHPLSASYAPDSSSSSSFRKVQSHNPPKYVREYRIFVHRIDHFLISIYPSEIGNSRKSQLQNIVALSYVVSKATRSAAEMSAMRSRRMISPKMPLFATSPHMKITREYFYFTIFVLPEVRDPKG